MNKEKKKYLARNRKAFHDYHIEESFEAGIVLTGTETKSIRSGHLNISEGWVDTSVSNSVILRQVHVTPYEFGNIYNHDPIRPRSLLLNMREIATLQRGVERKGYSAIPLSVYLKGRWIKVNIALVKGKKQYDKRQAKKEKQDEKDAKRELKSSLRRNS